MRTWGQVFAMKSSEATQRRGDSKNGQDLLPGGLQGLSDRTHLLKTHGCHLDSKTQLLKGQ